MTTDKQQKDSRASWADDNGDNIAAPAWSPQTPPLPSAPQHRDDEAPAESHQEQRQAPANGAAPAAAAPSRTYGDDRRGGQFGGRGGFGPRGGRGGFRGGFRGGDRDEHRERMPPREVPLPTEAPFEAFCRNLSFNCEAKDLAGFFGEQVVKAARVMRGEDGRHRGTAIVEFDELSQLQDALKRTGEEVMGRPIQVLVADHDHHRSAAPRRFVDRRTSPAMPAQGEQKEEESSAPVGERKKLELTPRTSDAPIGQRSEVYAATKADPFAGAKPRDEAEAQRRKKELDEKLKSSAPATTTTITDAAAATTTAPAAAEPKKEAAAPKKEAKKPQKKAVKKPQNKAPKKNKEAGNPFDMLDEDD